jgi:SanA protein
MELRYRDRIHTARDAPEAPVAIVFGAGLTGEAPSPLLAERLDTAIALYQQGRVQGLLLSGNSEPYHDEVGVMRRYVCAAGVPETAVEIDGEGQTTFESLLRAKQVYGVQQALLVTQRFHLPRSLFDASALGMNVDGVAADGERERPSSYPWRELLARPLALERVLAHRFLPPPEVARSEQTTPP